MSLPASTTAFVGRDRELAQISVLLCDPACRLLTLVGPGGIGKTRLAIEAARQQTFPDGVYFIPLQALSSSDFLVSSIADAIGLQLHLRGNPTQQLLDYLRDKSCLLVLDNFEHLLDGATLLSEILAAAPGVRILVTSRERLNLVEEWTLEVGGLAYPSAENAHETETYSAVELFMQRARRVSVGFTPPDADQRAIMRICRMVDGMPLPLELAASWVRVLSCEAIANEIARSLDILETSARNVEPRHRTMRAALDQSWQLLSDEERAVFRKLSVFRGGFTREAAEQVAGASLRMLTTIVDKSMVRVASSGRYDLQEILRQYSIEKLSELPVEQAQTQDRHCHYYAAFLKQCYPRILGSEVKAAYDEITIELENVRATWDWALRHQKIAEISLSHSSLSFFYGERGRYYEGVQAFARAASVISDDAPNSMITRANLQACQGTLLFNSNSPFEAKLLLLESVATLRRFEAKDGLAFALHCLGAISLNCDRDFASAAAYLQECLALWRELDIRFHIAHTLDWLAGVCREQYKERGDADDLAQAQQYALESLAINQQLGNPRGIAIAGLILGGLAELMGDYERAFQYAEKSLHIFQEIGIYWGIACALNDMGRFARAKGVYAEARRYLVQSLQSEAEHRISMFTESSLALVLSIWLVEGKMEQAYELLGLIDQEREPGEDSLRGEHFEDLRLLDDDLPPHLAAAVERGRTRGFDAGVKEIIAILSREVESAPAEPSPALLPQLPADPLTAREREILCLIADGLSNGEIAVRLVLATSTVKWYVNQIFGKLDATSRTQAAARARTLGLLTKG